MDNINETAGGRQVCTTKALAADIQRHHDDAQRCAGEAVEHARRAGEALLQAKAEIGHGKFQAWFDAAKFTFSDRTARGYMRVARELPNLPDGKRQRVADLSLRQALEYLAEPRQTDLQKAEALQARADTVRQTLDTLREDLDKAETPAECARVRDTAARLAGEAHALRAKATRELGLLQRTFKIPETPEELAAELNVLFATRQKSRRDAGRLFTQIRDEKIYRQDGYPSFREFCNAEFGNIGLREILDMMAEAGAPA